ncbi:gamma-interferon-inducible protein 16-like [Nycticebus coucang]|uniref:gamma-interferon-inducible protein 16-like n=1 Tax=Nycticebus coucang TaxID=9470 RepID=UPI00234C533C|nr:gamma-interferon-inducible protein 16-like [Nycticebus coucang]
MAKECWKIILIKGLEEINDDQFKMVKFLLTDPLKLTSKMQDEYGKVQFANLMVKKFPEDAGVDKLIKLCKEIASLQAFVEILKREKAKVMKRRSTPAKGKPPSKKNKQDEDSPAVPAPSTSYTVKSEGAEVTPGPQKRKTTGKGKDKTRKSKVSEEQPQPSCLPGASMPTAIGHLSPPPTSADPSKMSSTKKPKPQAKDPAAAKPNYLQKGPMTVMVLSAADPFEYESSEKEKKKMFHAIVATENKLFHMKVLNIKLKKNFTRNKILTISDYLEYKRLLEVNEASSVSEAGPDQKIEVPKNIISRAKETLKIDVLQTQAAGTIVYGLFMLCKKTLNKDNTIYEIKDDTGSMKVVGKGKCHNIPCEEGDKLQLFCFQLRKKNETSKLISEMHSFIQVKKKPNQRNNVATTVSGPEECSEILKHPEGCTTPIQRHLMTSLMPPASTSSLFIKGEEAASGTEISSAVSRAGALPVGNPHIYGTYQHTPSSLCQMSSPRAVSEEAVTEGHHSGPIEVMVLKATEPFVYEVKEERKMFHATVATERKVFQVKVFNINLKEMFTPKNIIAISNYIGRNGFLEVYTFNTSVLKMDADKKMEIPRSLINQAGRTPKISHLHSQTEGKFVNGVFLVHRKCVMDKFTYYEIKDNTGQMEVVVYGRLTSINCEEGDKLKLICFELASGCMDKRQLRSVIHSYMKVIKTRKINKEIHGPDSDLETSLDSFF